MANISMFPHMGSGNHGCEAIIRSTAQILNNKELHIFTDHMEEDNKYIKEICGKIENSTKEISPYTMRHIKALISKYILRDKEAFYKETYRPILNVCKKGDIFLCSGGDLYCYDPPEYIYQIHRFVKQQGCKTVLWGCSVEPSNINQKMKDDLKKYDLICARESITYEALKEINPNTILTIDPAFVLPVQLIDLPAEQYKYIGINVSPLIQNLESKTGITLENYINLIQYILDNTKDVVALIPHVVWKNTDDRVLLQKIKDYFYDNKRVILVDDHNAAEQKYIIGHCRMFVGARTHATIAAYSSCVPTLVVGYSVKAKGIAKDLFGEYEKYVIPVQNLKEVDDLVNAFKWLMSNEKLISKHLKEIMPTYISKIEILKTVLNK